MTGPDLTTMASRLRTDVDFARQGKQRGFITLSHSVHRSAYGVIRMPIACIANGSGPTVLLTAGNHGDEYEGQVALLKLMAALEPEQVSGRIIVVPALRFVLIDAVWVGKDRAACLPKNPGDVVGACWPFIQAKFAQFIYGFYPEPERWRVNLTFPLAAILLVPLLIPRLPAKGPNAILFFVALPVVAFFLLRGGGLSGFAVIWTTALVMGFIDSIAIAGLTQLLRRKEIKPDVVAKAIKDLGVDPEKADPVTA